MLLDHQLKCNCLFFQKEEQLCSEGGSSSEDQFSESELGIDEIQLLLQAMQFRRFVKNRFLNSFLDGVNNST